MIRSMYAGITGMKANQTKLDVIGNNISNVGTTAFKASRTTFKDALYQSSTNALAPSQNAGGTNAKQVGLGVQLGAIDTIMTQGAMQPTSRSLDVGIDGNGYFMVAKGNGIYEDNALVVNHEPGTHNILTESLQTSGAGLMYTRDGAFTLDAEGNLLTSDGYRVLGYSLSNDKANSEATAKAPAEAGTKGFMFNFTAGAGLNNYKIEVVHSNNTSTTAKIEGNIIKVSGDFDEDDGTKKIGIENAINKAINAAGISQTVTVAGTFDDNINTPAEISGGTPVQSVGVDGVINFVNGNMEVHSYDNNLKTLRIPDKIKVAGTNEYLSIKNFSISDEGIITAVLEDGSVSALGQIAMATFKNTEGLTKVGGNAFIQSANSGEAFIRTGIKTLGEENNDGYGALMQGYLEMSNVDLTEQFTDMIVTSRAFQASGKMITTGDEILQEIINLKR
ncbi:flagellar hook protein FlgE [Alloiococcus sp. CFN-8]|uniref:flagellar hook protein FlgE n=1 Tax=Alloiococcus sp. CFN-8 TaxID=3416081 RepID=UPI003CF1AC11